MVKTQPDIPVDQLQQPNVQMARVEQSSSSYTVMDIGCGRNKVPGAIGVDCMALPGVDVVHDLDCFPYPFAADSVDEIHINHVLEHLPNVIATMEELWRICKPNAKLHIRVPHFTGILAWKDPTHRRSFTSESFGYFGDNDYSFYTHARFQVMSVRLQYSTQLKTIRWIARVLTVSPFHGRPVRLAGRLQRLSWNPTRGTISSEAEFVTTVGHDFHGFHGAKWHYLFLCRHRGRREPRAERLLQRGDGNNPVMRSGGKLKIIGSTEEIHADPIQSERC